MRFLVLFLLILPSLWAADVTMTWTYDFTGGKVCSATVTSNCFEKFETGTLAGTTFTKLSDVPLPPNPTGIVTGISSNFQYNSDFGSKTLSVIMVAKDNAGVRITSHPEGAKVDVVIPPSVPSNVKVIVNVSVTYP